MKQLSLIVLISLLTTSIQAQKWLEKVGKKVSDRTVNQVENRIENRAAQGVEKGMNKTESAVKKGTGADQQKPGQQNTDKNVRVQDNQNQPGPSKAGSPGLESYSKYDFVPGEKVIFYEDFSNVNTGDFPVAWNTNGSGEVVTTNLYPGKWLKYAGNKCIWTDELLKLPENYTIEFDVVPTSGTEGKGMAGWEFRLMQSINAKSWDGGAVPGKSGFALGYEYFGRPYYRAYDNELDGKFWDMKGFGENKDFWNKENQKYHMAVWVQKSRVRVYQGQGKLFDLPKAIPDSKTSFDRLRFDQGAAMITNIRIAVGAPDTRSKLITEGKLISYGIYFDVNKDIVKPESYGTLKDIAQVLKDNPDVKVKIVGHTDSDGDDASNLDLSKRRGAAVKNELVKSFNIEGSRLESDGMGEKQPVAKNDTPANKAQNIRVEFIKV
jgi:outer membrane protein OmpA-like peptidoglycan-associated protein